MLERGIGEFSFTFRSPDLHGMGFSSSSVFAVLFEAAQGYLATGTLDPQRVARAALRFERRADPAMAFAADDVYPIVYGGVLKVSTFSNTLRDGVVEFGEVAVEPIACDAAWLAGHVVVGFDPAGERHSVGDALGRLFQHPSAHRHIDALSACADRAAAALEAHDAAALGAAVNDYRDEMDRWTGGAFGASVADVARSLEGEVAGWKAPGGGANRSLLAVARGPEATEAIARRLRALGWWAGPLRLSHGVAVDVSEDGRRLHFTAPHRADFVGVADLGQHHRVATPGRCCSCAIEPRPELVLELAVPSGPPRAAWRGE